MHDVPDVEDIPHVSEVEDGALNTLTYVRDDDTVYRVLPNHEGHGRFDLIEIEDEEDSA